MATTMNDNNFVTTLQDTLKELNISRNALAVESKIRPATIQDLFNGTAKQVNFETLKAIIDALNRIAAEKGSSKRYVVKDVFEYGENENSAE